MQVTVHVACQPNGITQGCVRCRQVKRRGNYLVILIAGGKQYFVGEEVTPQCCGEAKDGWFSLYKSRVEADQEAARVDAVIAHDGHLENLRLIQRIALSSAPTGAEN